MSQKAKMAAVLMMTLGLVLGAATAALAHTVAIKIHCNEVRVTFDLFPSTGTHSATVDIDGDVHSISWSGQTHTVTFPISAENGDVVTVDVEWHSSQGLEGTASSSMTVMDCGPEPSPSPSPSPTTSPSPSPSPTTSPSPSPSPSPTASPSPSPSPSPTTSPSPSPAPVVTTPPPPPPGGEAEVKPQVVQPKPGGQAAGQAQGGQAAGALAFTGPTPAFPVIASLAALLFLTGLATLVWGSKYRGVHRAS
jgi:hypothetical protein